ncbi:MAG: hypothetical protein ACOCUI_04830 [bacterium]
MGNLLTLIPQIILNFFILAISISLIASGLLFLTFFYMLWRNR